MPIKNPTIIITLDHYHPLAHQIIYLTTHQITRHLPKYPLSGVIIESIQTHLSNWTHLMNHYQAQRWQTCLNQRTELPLIIDDVVDDYLNDQPPITFAQYLHDYAKHPQLTPTQICDFTTLIMYFEQQLRTILAHQ